MTIEEIRANHATMTIDQLEAEIRARDVSVQALRAEMLEIRQRLEPHVLMAQRAQLQAAINKGATTVELVPSVKLGGQ